jgi:5-methylcytosine-specific restriction endonuclease McrA
VLAAFGHRCAQCGATGVALDVHHQDHTASNNAPSNLTLLCKPCHAKAGMRLL